MSKRLSVRDLAAMRQSGEPICALTAYDYTFAKLVDAAGIHLILVGDSLGNVIKGDDTTLAVTIEEIIYHTKSVVRGARRALVVADMPFLSYHISTEDAVRSAGRLLKESGAQAVKLEGGSDFAPQVEAIVRAGIPVVGHIGLLPQRVHQSGGYRVQGKNAESARRLLSDARCLEQAGAIALVLEGIPAELAGEITQSVGIPTIGIGAGAKCSGQILVLHDALGLNDTADAPKFVKAFGTLGEAAKAAVQAYCSQVASGKFPDPDHSY